MISFQTEETLMFHSNCGITIRTTKSQRLFQLDDSRKLNTLLPTMIVQRHLIWDSIGILEFHQILHIHEQESNFIRAKTTRIRAHPCVAAF